MNFGNSLLDGNNIESDRVVNESEDSLKWFRNHNHSTNIDKRTVTNAAVSDAFPIKTAFEHSKDVAYSKKVGSL